MENGKIANGAKVVVTTAHRGVFFGELLSKNGSDVALTNARVCVYWSQETRGFVGLAATGPLAGSRVSPACPTIELSDVTATLECSPEAVERWEAGPW